jgi:exonuclease III
MSAIKLLTFNIFGARCADFAEFDKILGDCDPEVMLTQELGNTNKHKSLGPYDYIDSAGYGGEIVGIHAVKGKKCGEVNKISTSGKKLKVADRHAILATYKGIRVANLHLEGGRYSDQTLFTDFKGLLDYKLQLLQKVISHAPDIIMGDFNSVYNSHRANLGKYLAGQYKYFQTGVLRQTTELTTEQKEMINKWNSAPYELLQKAGYKYAKPDNESTAITNGRGNSIIDTIWYNPKTVSLVKSHILTQIIRAGDDYAANKCISDHNPVFAEFQTKHPQRLSLKNRGQQKKTSNSKTAKK